MATKCIDISAWQGNVSASDFKETGISCVILRTSYTAMSSFSLHKDKVFDNNITAAHKANLKIGAYHYSQAISESEAVKEAEFVIKILKPYKSMISLPVAIDWEFGRRLNSYVARNLGKQRCKQICDAFCRTIRAAGYEPMVYANLSTLNGYIADTISKSWPIWVAQYNSRCDYRHPYYMWQYSSSGRVSGISGRVDMNYIYDSKPKPGKKYTGELPALPKRDWFTSGDKGPEVKKLQKFLNWYGSNLSVDGKVGPKTMNAVGRFQSAEGLVVDKLFGKKCLEKAKGARK